MLEPEAQLGEGPGSMPDGFLPLVGGPTRQISGPDGVVLEPLPVEVFEQEGKGERSRRSVLSRDSFVALPSPPVRRKVFEPPPLHRKPWDESFNTLFANCGADFHLQKNTRSYFDRTRERQNPNNPPEMGMKNTWSMDPATAPLPRMEEHEAETGGLRMSKSHATLGMATVGTSWPKCASWATVAHHRGADVYETGQKLRRRRSEDWIYLRGLEKHPKQGKILPYSWMKWRKPREVQRPRWNEEFHVHFSKANVYSDPSQRDYFEAPRSSDLFERRVGGRGGGASRGVAAERYHQEFYGGSHIYRTAYQETSSPPT